MSTIRQLLLIFALIILGIAASLLISIVAPMMGGMSLKWLQATSVICTFLLPVAGYLWIGHEPHPLRYLHADKSLSTMDVAMIPLITLSLTPLINILAQYNEAMSLPAFMAPIERWMQQMEAATASATRLLLAAENGWQLLANLFVIALLAAVAEELIFRGVLWRIFGRWIANPHLLIWTLAAIFSAIHMQFYGFVPRLLLGAMMGYLLLWTGSIYAPILAHFSNNALGVIASYLLTEEQMTHLETLDATPLTLTSALIGALPLLIYALRKRMAMQRNNNQPFL